MLDFSARRVTRRATVGLAGAAVAFSAAIVPLGAAQAAETGDQVNLLTFNDFHGALSGADAFACTVVTTQAQHENSTLLSAGDSVGGTQFASALQDDNPTIDYLNALGVDASAVGNHEFDQGHADLTDRIIPRADFPYLAANVYQGDERLVEPYAIVDAGDVRVAVVGAVTTKTLYKVSPAAIEGLEFRDPVDSVNEAIEELQASGEEYDVLVASYHEGASGDASAVGVAPSNTDPIFTKIVEQTSPEADAIFNGDSHKYYAFNAPVPGTDGAERPIVQTGDNGNNLGSVTLELGDDGDWTLAADGLQLIPSADTDPATCAGDPTFEAASQIAADAIADATELGAEPVGTVNDDITTAWAPGDAQYVDGVWTANGPTGATDIKGDSRANFSTAGNMLADSMKWFFDERGGFEDQEVIGWMNPGGIRAEFWYEQTDGEGDGVVTYGEANSVVPFGNTLYSGEVSGAQFKQILEEQWQSGSDADGDESFLAFGVSENVTYVYDSSRDLGDRVIDLRINGEQVDLEATYTIVTASFLFEGGDGMHTLAQAQNVQDTGVFDRDALTEYFEANPDGLTPDYASRQLDLQVVEPGVYNEAEGVDTDPVLRVRGAESLSLGAPQIEKVIVDAGQYGTFEAPYELNEETQRYFGDVTLTDWLCVPEGTVVPLSITAVPETGTAITIDMPSFEWTSGTTPDSCVVPGDGDGDGGDGDDGEPTPAPGDGDDGEPTPAPGDGGGEPAPGSGGGSGDGSGDGDQQKPVAGGDNGRGDLARTGADIAPYAAGIMLTALAGFGALGLRRRMTRD